MPAGMWFPAQLTALFLLTAWRSASCGIAGAGTDGPRLKWDHEDMGSSGGSQAGLVKHPQGNESSMGPSLLLVSML